MKRSGRYDYEEYADQLTPEELDLTKKFYKQYYESDLYNKEDKVVLNEKARSTAIRHHNNQSRDAFDVAQKVGAISELTSKSQVFMEDASDDIEWRDVFSKIGFTEAVHTIIRQALKNLDNKELKKDVTLVRFHSKMMEVSKLHRRTQKGKQS